MFQKLSNYIGVTPEQSALLSDSRHVATELDETFTTSLHLLTSLRFAVSRDGNDLDGEFQNVQQIMNPTQMAKFVCWVTNNPACMHMLNELWAKGMTPEQQQAGATTQGDILNKNPNPNAK